jgi:hypothetical protein
MNAIAGGMRSIEGPQPFGTLATVWDITGASESPGGGLAGLDKPKARKARETGAHQPVPRAAGP